MTAGRRVAIAVLSLGALSSCGGSSGEVPFAVDDVGEVDDGEDGDVERLPDVDITGLISGESILLSEIDGPAVVNLWATWCAPCRAEIPDFEEVHQARSDDVRFVGINIGEGSERAAAFIEEVGATYDQFTDDDGDVSIELRATAMPLTVVIDADGFVTERHLGPLDQAGLNEAIDEALGLAAG